jgi:hypothetical protein
VNNLKKFNIFKLKNHSSTESQKRGRKWLCLGYIWKMNFFGQNWISQI